MNNQKVSVARPHSHNHSHPFKIQVIEKDGQGSFNFGAVEVGLDCTTDKTDGKNRIAFGFSGFDEGTEVSGRG